jgi:hypothetical protein
MFKALQTIVSTSSRAGGNIRRTNTSKARTLFSQEDGTRVMIVTFKGSGRRGNGYVANLLKITATKWRFRLWGSDGTRLNTITKEDASPPSTVIAQLVDAINANATFSTYINVQFLNETTEAMSDSVDIGDGQTLRGGR